MDGCSFCTMVAADAWAEMKKTSANIHHMDAAIGALIGGAYTTHQASDRHKQLPSGETPYSKKLRKEMEYHLEMRQERGQEKNPSFGDRLKEKMIRTQLRYANVAQNNPHAAMAVEGLAGAAAGAVAVSSVGNAIRKLYKGSALGFDTDANDDADYNFCII